MFSYFEPIWTAGYPGYVLYHSDMTHCSVWMIPGTWFYDWDNR